MQITTSDKKVVGSFEKVQSIACKFQKALEKTLPYNGHDIAIPKVNQSGQKIPKILQDMKQCRWEGKIYSGDDKIFFEDFAKHFKLLLSWLCSVKQPQKQKTVQLKVSALHIKDILRWLGSLMNAVGCCSITNQIQISKMNKQLEKQGIWC
jgi:hypothetical protein